MFNFLSGSSVDNSRYLLFDMFATLSSYIGFSRSNKFFWGENALIAIQHERNYPADVVDCIDGLTTNIGTNKFYDLNSTSVTGYDYDSPESEAKRLIHIYYTNISDDDFDLSAARLIPNSDIAINDGNLYLNYINENWALIQNLNPLWMTIEPFNDFENYKFYITNYKNSCAPGETPFAKIRLKTIDNILTYNKKCKLMFYKNASTTEADAIQLGNTIEKSVNVIGEVFFNGLDETEFRTDLNLVENNLLATDFINKDAYFNIEDLDGNVLNGPLRYESMTSITNANMASLDLFTVGQDSKFLLLKEVIDNETKEYQIIVSDFYNDKSLAIWHESYPSETARTISDANPPALHTSFLKFPYINSCIFDVLGMQLINKSTDLWFAKKISKNDATSYSNISNVYVEDYVLKYPTKSYHSGIIAEDIEVGSNKIYLEDGHNFVTGDNISIFSNVYTIEDVVNNINNSYILLNKTIPSILSAGLTLKSLTKTDIVVNDKIVKTNVLSLAKKYAMEEVMIDIDVDAVGDFSPTEDIYKQIFICVNPTVFNTPTTTATGIVKHEHIFSQTTYSYDLGTIKYIANKIPILRKTITNNKEHFRIIL